MKSKLNSFGILLALALPGISPAETVLQITPSDFYQTPASYKALVPWWCPPDSVYSACEACVTVGGPQATQGPTGPGICQNGSSGLELTLDLPPIPYEHCAGSGRCGPGQGSFCATFANNATSSNGGGGGAFGGCWDPGPLPASVSVVVEATWGATVTKHWRARFRQRHWRCISGDCELFRGIH